VIEAGSSPELREVVAGLAALTEAVGSLTEVQARNTLLLEHLVGTVAKEPGEGQELHNLLATLVVALQDLPARIEAAVTRSVQAG